MAGQVEGKVALVTGGASGIGEAVVELLAKEGATVVATDIDELRGPEVVARIAKAGGKAAFLEQDVTSEERWVEIVAEIAKRFGRLDVLVSNAGVLAPNGRIHNLATEDWERSFQVNVLGAVHGIRSAVGVMRPQGSGSIVLTASVAGMTAWSHSAPYCATKAAVIQLAKVAALEYARDGIRVNCVCPGTFRSAIHEGLPPDALDAIAARHPLGLGTPDDLVGAYAYLAGDESRWTTGAALVVDGGYSAP